MSRTFIVAAVLGLLAGCGSEPDGPVLEGQWGGEQLEVVADRDGAQVRPACGVIHFRDPIVLDADGSADRRGVFDAVSYFRRVEVQLILSGDRLSVRLTWLNPDGSTYVESRETQRGASADYSGVVCLA